MISESLNDQKASLYQLCWAANEVFILHLCPDVFLTLVVVYIMQYIFMIAVDTIPFLKCNGGWGAAVDLCWIPGMGRPVN